MTNAYITLIITRWNSNWKGRILFEFNLQFMT